MADRAASDVVGFVLVFSLVTATVGVVYGVGFTGLEDVRDAERVTNAERAFDILADNLADVRARGAPSRATEIKLSEARLFFGNATTLSVEITNVGSPAPEYSVSLRPVVYAAGTGTRLVYEAGAVVRTEPGGGVVFRRDPGLLFADAGGTRTAVIPLVETRRTGGTSVGGSRTVRVRADLAVSEVLTTLDGGPFDVEFTVETSARRAAAWERYLDGEIASAFGVSDPCSTTDGTVTCAFAVDRLSVSATRVDLGFD